ncbi:MAG TPA: DedA family protein [Streptosporangiaceae bacterium]|jgi:membrane protein DedA with SNARE-associated domain
MDSFIVHAGYAALIVLGFLEACCIPISSEVTFGFAGVLAYQGHLSLALVIIIGTLAELAGSYVSYAVGRVGERPLVDRIGRYVLVTRSDIDRAERFLLRRGAWAIPLGRVLPFVRSFTSVVAGFARVPAPRFGVLSLIGTAVYAAVVASIGYALGPAWNRVSHDLSIAGYLIAAVVIAAIIGLILLRLRALRQEARSVPEPAKDTAQAEQRVPPPDGHR